MLLGLALMIAAHAGAWLLAAALQSRLPTGSRSADLCGAFVLHALIVTLIVLAVGNAGVIGPWALAAGGILAGAAGWVLGGARTVASAWISAKQLARETFQESRWVVGMCAVVIGAVVLRHLFNAWYFAPHTGDGNEYHLPKLVTWIQNGTLQRPDMLDTRSFFPAGMQVLQVWWTAFLHHDVIIEGASLESAVLAAAATAGLARHLGLSRTGALLAGTLFATTPAALMHATAELNDLPVAALVLAGFALVTAPTLSWSALVLAAAALCIGTGVKPTAAFASTGVLLLAILRWRSGRPAGAPIPAAKGLLALAILAGSYWYLINWVEFGSPTYPAVASAEGVAEIGVGKAKVASRPSLTRMLQSAGDLFGPRLIALGPDVDTRLKETTGWGWTLAIAGLPALLWMVISGGGSLSRRLVAGAFILSLAMTLLMVERDPYNARFVLWFAALLAISAAAVVPVSALGYSFPLVALLVAASTVNVVMTAVTPVVGDRVEALKSMASVSWRERDAGRLFFPLLPADERRLAEIPTDPVMCITFNYPVYTLSGADFRRRVDYVVTDRADVLAVRMASAGTPHLLVINVPSIVQRAVEEAEKRGSLRWAAPGWYERTGR